MGHGYPSILGDNIQGKRKEISEGRVCEYLVYDRHFLGGGMDFHL